MEGEGNQGYRRANRCPIILSMTAFLVFSAALAAVDVLARKYGADSRRHDGRPAL